MKVAVAGLWHLGTVTAACLASGGHHVIAFDEPEITGRLIEGELPVREPGLAALMEDAMKAARLQVTSDPTMVSDVEVLWVCYDTPVDDEDRADTEAVCSRVRFLLPHISDRALVLISSQLPVGTTSLIEAEWRRACPRSGITFGYAPENLRLGKAIEVFTKPDRFVVGLNSKDGRARVTELLAAFTSRIEWMSVESAEMTKHALNAFLATSVAFINEIASVCELVGADAQEVERGLKTDIRIGERAYLHAGGAFAGGTLARDVSFLLSIGKNRAFDCKMLRGVWESNTAHKSWTRRTLTEIAGDLAGSTITLLGLTYKPGTNTLRRSQAVEFMLWMNLQGANVRVFDPAVSTLPPGLSDAAYLGNSVEDALTGSDAAILTTCWPEFRDIRPSTFVERMRNPVIVDPERFLERSIGNDPQIEYLAFGKGSESRAVRQHA